jgi:hypothetical protein
LLIFFNHPTEIDYLKSTGILKKPHIIYPHKTNLIEEFGRLPARLVTSRACCLNSQSSPTRYNIQIALHINNYNKI